MTTPSPERDAAEASPAQPARGLPHAKVAVLVAAVAFLVGAVAFAVGQSTSDPLNDVDVGYMQDMGYHHDQAVSMSLMLLGKEGIDPNLLSFAQEIVIGQRYEQGIFSATLDRYGYSSDPGEEVMGWMGLPQPVETMEGWATDEQIEQLLDAEGEEAEALWIALMTEHHLGGLHMADYAARHGGDESVTNLAIATVRNQRSEIIDIQRYRTSNGVPIPEGFTDPLEDQRLNPVSFTDPPG